MQSASRDKILNKIKQALQETVPVPFPGIDENQVLFTDKNEEHDLLFADNFTRLLGRFSFCEDEKELTQQLAALLAARQMDKVYCIEEPVIELLHRNQLPIGFWKELASCDASITTCEALVARTGSILLSSKTASGRTASVYAPIHICIAYTSQLVFDIKDALELMTAKYKNAMPSLITFATGPSRTADIEKTLVVGVHGPKEVYCFLVND